MKRVRRRTTGGAGKATLLGLEDRLPLTCTRSGRCCHGKAIWLNPWELACLARAKGLSPLGFRERFTSHGGIRVRMEEDIEQTCGQYDPAIGCSVYAGRPLACRLYPLGRRRAGETVRYHHAGAELPCLDGCPEVRALPSLTVAEFLVGQQSAAGEAAQDAYLELTLDLADAALVLVLERGLEESGHSRTLRRWSELGLLGDEARAAQLPRGWFDALTAPALEAPLDDPRAFVAEHLALLQALPEASVVEPATPAALHEACCLLMASSLHLGRATGADAAKLAEHCVATARRHLRPAG